MRLAVAGVLLFGSGFAALIYQTVWQRLFCLIFGASTGASAAVLGVFLGGLGLGGAWLGKRVENSQRPLLYYANLELVVALCAAATPLLTDLAARGYFALGGSGVLGTFGATLVRLVLAALVMGPATVAMGGTLPAMARAVEHDGDAMRERLAVLYTVNTLGAVMGSLLGTFVLFEVLGQTVTLWFACLINLLVAIIARTLGRRQELVVVNGALDEPAPRVEENPAAHDRGKGELTLRISSSWLAYAAAGVVGFAFLMLEMIWYRMLTPLLGGTTYTFGLILAVALTGIGLGAYLYSRRTSEVTFYSLAATLGLEAFFAAVPILLGDSIALFAAYTRPMAAMGFDGLLTSWTLIALVVVFPTALISGYQFPVIFALLGQGRRGVAAQVGLAYACNTLGSIAGAILAGFVLIPWLGAVGSWRLVVAGLVVACCACLTVALLRTKPVRRAAGGWVGLLAVLATLAACAQGPTGVWRHEPIGAGRAQFVSNLDRNGLEQWLAKARGRTVWEADGKESSVRLSDESSYTFSINGKSDGSVWGDRGTQAMLGVLPALLHPKPERAFVIGLGTGMSAGWLAQLRSMQKVDVAELEPVILDVARAAHQANAEALQNPKVSVFLGDAREFMLTSKERYDVIASEPSNPYRAGIASLFTLEFYRVVAEHLNPGGIFAQWVQGYEIDVTTLRTVLRTLRQVFPFVEVWQSQGGDFEILASKEPRNYSRAMLEQKLAEPTLVDLIPRVWLVEGVEGVLAHFVADMELTVQVSELGDPPINTDDANVLEYAFARTVGKSTADGAMTLLVHAMATGHARPAVAGEVDWPRVDELRPRAWLINEGAAPALAGLSVEASKRLTAVGQACAGDARQILPSWTASGDREPRDIIETYALGLGYGALANDAALPFAARLDERGFMAESLLVQAELHAAKGDAVRAVELLTRSLREQRRKALALCGVTDRTLLLLERVAIGNRELAKQAVAALLEGPVADHVAEGKRVDTLERLAFASGDAQLCVRAMQGGVLQPRWSKGFLFRRHECLKAVGSPLAETAEQDLLEFLTSEPGTFGTEATPNPAQGGSTVP